MSKRAQPWQRPQTDRCKVAPYTSFETHQVLEMSHLLIVLGDFNVLAANLERFSFQPDDAYLGVISAGRLRQTCKTHFEHLTPYRHYQVHPQHTNN